MPLARHKKMRLFIAAGLGKNRHYRESQGGYSNAFRKTVGALRLTFRKTLKDVPEQERSLFTLYSRKERKKDGKRTAPLCCPEIGAGGRTNSYCCRHRKSPTLSPDSEELLSQVTLIALSKASWSD